MAKKAIKACKLCQRCANECKQEAKVQFCPKFIEGEEGSYEF